MKIPSIFRKTASQGTPWIHGFFQKHKDRSIPALSTQRKHAWEHIQEEILLYGVPDHLTLTYVHPHVQTGVFLKRTAKPIAKGTLIGAYTGAYELVPSEATTGNSYCYDVVQHIHLSSRELRFVKKGYKHLSTEEEYSIQTNALPMGNFTRFINHSSTAPNVEAIIHKIHGHIEVFLFAKHKICPGEQLLSNYGGSYWQALGIIPNILTPTTYRLPKKGRVQHCYLEETLSKAQRLYLTPLRHTRVHIPEEVLASSLYQKLCRMLPKLSQRQKTCIDLLEEEMLERSIPSSVFLQRNGRAWALYSKHRIPKGTLIALCAGTLSLSHAQEALLLGATSKRTLFLLLKKQPNAFSLLPLSSHGSLSWELVFDKEQKVLFCLLRAARAIKAKESLTLLLPDPLMI